MSNKPRKLDPKAAASEIRDKVVNHPAPPPTIQHMYTFVHAVCNELGVEPSPQNFIIVAEALHDADIQPHLMQEYPKMLTVDGKPVLDDDGHYVIFESASDEADYHAGVDDDHHSDELLPEDDAKEHAAHPTVADVTTTVPGSPKVVESPKASEIPASPHKDS